MSNNNIDTLLAKASANRHEEVVKSYSKLDDAEQLNKHVMMAYGDSLYELNNDLSALKIYLELFIK